MHSRLMTRAAARARFGGLAMVAVAMAIPAVEAFTPTVAMAAPPPVSLVAYDSIGSSVAGNVASVGFEATGTKELGDLVQLVPGPHVLDHITVEMSSWACQSGSWSLGTCTSAVGATYNHPLTVSVYANVGTPTAPLVSGPPLAAVTKSAAIPFRPSADPINCTGANAGKWYDATSARCFNGKAFPVQFNFGAVVVPSQLVWTIRYNTSTSGNFPIGPTCVVGTFCGYDSLNVGTETQAGAPFAGHDVDTSAAFVKGRNATAYCSASPAQGFNVLQNDPGCWNGFTPMATIVTEPGPTYTPVTTVVDRLTVNPADFTKWSFWQETSPEAPIPATFTSGPGTPPVGTGSAQLSVSGPSQGTSVRTPAYATTKLSDLQTLSFSMYSATGISPGLSFDVNFAGESGYSGRLVYEPVYDPDATVTPGAWNTFDVLHGQFWASATAQTKNGGRCQPTGPGPNPLVNSCSLDQILLMWPNAKISGNLVVQLGSGAPASTVNVDNVTVGVSDSDGNITETTYDFEDKCSTVCYVDDSGSDSNTGLTVGSPLRNIQTAVNAVSGGPTSVINVGDGEYNEDVTVDKEVTINGAGPDESGVSGPIGGPTSTFTVAASNVVIDGFGISRDGNNTTDWNDPGLNTAGISVQGQAISGTIIRNNRLTGNRTGIDINNTNGVTVTGNAIVANRTGLILRNQTDNTTVTHNQISANWTVGVLFLDASGGTNSPVQSAASSNFTGNDISANWYGQIVDRQSGGSLPAPGTNLKNFSANWLGSLAPVVTTANSAEPGYAAQIPVTFGGSAVAPGGQPDIAGPASANFDFTPLLESGTDQSAAPGFQGSTAAVLAHDVGAQVGSTGRVQEGVDLVDVAGRVDVADGTYAKPTVIDQAVTIAGESEAGTILDGTSTPTLNGITFAGPAVSNVSLHDFTVTEFKVGISATSLSNLSDLVVDHVSADHNHDDGIRLNTFAAANLTFSNVNASDNGDRTGVNGSTIGRGLILQDSVKTNINVINGTYNNNSLSGIDINDGTVDGLTITGNQASDNGDEGIGVLGSVSTGANSTLVSGNTVADNGRFGIEVKNSTGNGALSGPGSLVVTDNTVSRSNAANPNATNAARDYAGISVTRRNPQPGQPGQPSGAAVTNNTVTGFVRKATAPNGDGFGIVVEGAGNVVRFNHVTGNNIGIQIQSENTPDQFVPPTPGFDRGSGGTPAIPSSALINYNEISGSTDYELRNVGAPVTDATCNYFGVADIPIGPISGLFTLTPILHSSDLDATCPPPTAPSTTVVTKAALGTFEFVLESAGPDEPTPARFAVGPVVAADAPAGIGSVAFTDLPDNKAIAIRTKAFDTTSLAKITRLEYSTYQTTTLAPTLSFDVDFNPGAAGFDDKYHGRLVYIPTVTTPGVWTTWNTLTGAHWYASKQGAAANRCGLADLCTWAQVQSYWPNAAIHNPDVNNPDQRGALLIREGSTSGEYNGQTAFADQLIIGVESGTTTPVITEQTFDFEPLAPSAPQNVVASNPGDGTADVAWSAPVNDGGDPVSAYTVVPTAGSGSCIVNFAARTAACSGLTNGTAYMFTVTAVNAVGAGDPAISNSVTPRTTASAPLNVVASNPGNGTASLAWDTPADDGGNPIVNYTAVPSGAASGSCVVTVASRTAECTGLTNGVSVTFDVAAVNGAGAGATGVSNVVVPFTTPSAPQNVVASNPGDGTADVSWTAPVSDNGRAITSYTVVPSGVLPGSCAVDFASRTAACSGLTNGTSYTFVVRAVNIAGPGDPGVSNSVKPVATAPSTTVVTQPSLGAWDFIIESNAADEDAPARFAPGPATAPIGVGSALYTDIPVNKAIAVITEAYTGTALADITELTYSTYQATQYAPYLGFDIDYDPGVGPFAGSYQGRISYVPDVQPGQVGVWTTWDTMTGARWFASKPSVNGNRCTALSLCTWAEIQANWPNAVIRNPDNGGAATHIGRLLIRAGGTTEDHTGESFFADNLKISVDTGSTIDAKTYDFEPLAPSAPQNVVASGPGNHSANVAWDVPVNDGGDPVTSYAVVPASGPGSCVVNFAARTAACTGLVNGVSMTFVVTATNSTGTGDQATSNSVKPLTTPSAPLNVVGSNPGNGSADVAWDAPADNGGDPVTNYTAVPTGGAPGTCVVNFAAKTAHCTGLTNGDPYTFDVAAVNGAGAGAIGVSAPAVTPVTVPTAPQNVVASAPGNHSATVTWDAPADDGGTAVTSYTVVPTGGAAGTCAVTFASETAACSGLTNGVSYTFDVAAVNAVGAGPVATSNAVIPVTTPSAPLNPLALNPGNTVADVQWDAPTDDGGSAITSYTVTPSAAGSCAVNFAARTAHCTGLTNGTSYTFTIKAVNAVGAGAAALTNAVKPLTVPTAPLLPTASNPGNGSADVSWDAPAGDGGDAISSYTVVPTGGAAGTCVVNFAAETAHCTGLVNADPYTFDIAAVNGAGAGPVATTNSVTPFKAPLAPQNVVASNPGNGTADVAWDAPSSNNGSAITSYTVVPSAAGTCTVNFAARTAACSGLTNGVTYTFTVTAVNAAGAGDPAVSNPVTPITTPSAPQNVVAVAGDASATVSWSAPASNGGSAVSGYTAAPTSGPGSCVVLPPTTASCTGLVNGNSITITVRAVNGAGTGAGGVSNSVTPLAAPVLSPPGAPTGVTAVAGDSTATVSWTAPASAGSLPITGYTVAPTSGPGFCTVTGLTATCSGLTNGVTITISVNAFNPFGPGPSAISNPITPSATGVGGPSVLDFTPAGPRRVFDTRPGQSPDALRAVAKAKIGTGTVLEVKMTDLPGLVPAAGVGAVSLNVTVTNEVTSGFVTVFPCGTQPFVSSVNFVPNTNVANAVIAPVSPTGSVCFFANSPVDLIADVNGWFAQDRAFVPTEPTRVFDTRPGQSPNAVVAVPKTKLVGGTAMTVQMTGLSGLTPATGVGTVSLNVTVADPAGAGFITVYDCGTRLEVSSVNYAAGQTVANAVLAPVSATGTVCFFSQQTTDLIVDINGYLEVPSGFTGVSPQRVLDSRVGFSPNALRDVPKQKIGGSNVLEVKLTDLPGAVPASGVGAVSLNVTAVGPVADGFLTVYPCGTRPDSSSVNYTTGSTVANAVITPLSATGTICIYSQNLTDVVVDINGWFSDVPS